MIALDTSSLIAYLGGSSGTDVEAMDLVLAHHQGVLPPVVLSELLSNPQLPPSALQFFRELPLLDISEGYWERAGRLRAKLISRDRKAPLADALIAQSCLDHDVALLTRDEDFGLFVSFAGLKLFP